MLGIVIALSAGVDPQADLANLVPAIPTQLACIQKHSTVFFFLRLHLYNELSRNNLYIIKSIKMIFLETCNPQIFIHYTEENEQYD